MVRDPYLLAWVRRRRNQARAKGFAGVLREWVVPAVGVALLLPLVHPVFFSFLTLPSSLWPLGAQEVTLRASMVVIGWMGLDLYGRLVRGGSRDVLAVLPVDAGRVVRSEIVALAVARVWWIPACAVLFSPLAWAGAGELWFRSVVAVSGNALFGLSGGACAMLAAVAVARNPRFAPLLDLVRGNNPRASAAFLYAPASVLLAAGGLLWASSAGVAHRGPLADLGLLVPAIVGLLAFAPIPWLARRTWFAASAVVAEMDGRPDVAVDPDEARRVYLEWVVRWLPSTFRRDALDDLRHGWRTRRTLVTGAWFFGLAAAAAAFTAGADRASAVALVGALAVGANGVLLAVDEPEVLRRLLPRPIGLRAVARGVVLGMWTVPIGVLGAAATWVRVDGAAAGGVALAAGMGWAWGAALSGMLGPLRQRGLGLYGTAAVLFAAALLWVRT